MSRRCAQECVLFQSIVNVQVCMEQSTVQSTLTCIPHLPEFSGSIEICFPFTVHILPLCHFDVIKMQGMSIYFRHDKMSFVLSEKQVTKTLSDTLQSNLLISEVLKVFE